MSTLAAFPGPSLDPLLSMLKYGQFGAALAMLVLGFYLHWQASASAGRDKGQLESRKGVAKQFMLFALAFFAICSVGEIIKGGTNSAAMAMIAVPPLDKADHKNFGDILITMDDGSANPETKPALSVAQTFHFRNNALFTIDLNGLRAQLFSTKKALETELQKTTIDIGPGDLQ